MYRDYRNTLQNGVDYNPKRARVGPAPPGMSGSDYNPFAIRNTHDDPHSSSTIQFQTNNTHSVNVEVQPFAEGWQDSFFKSFVWAYTKTYTMRKGKKDEEGVDKAADLDLNHLRESGLLTRNGHNRPMGIHSTGGTTTLLMHLPLVNYHLMKEAIRRADDGEPSMKLHEVLDSIQPAGVIDSHETLVDIHSFRSRDVRKCVFGGPVDVHNIWTDMKHVMDALQNPDEESSKRDELTENDCLYFIVYPVKVGSVVVKEFEFDQKTKHRTVELDNSKRANKVEYFYQVYPYYNKGQHTDGSKFQNSKLSAKSAVWKVGRCEYGAKLNYNKFEHMNGDPMSKFSAIVKAPIMSMIVDVTNKAV